MNLLVIWLCALAAFAILLALPFVVAPLRRILVSRPLLVRFRQVMPRMSETERDALEAGTVSWDGELFSGRPAWSQLFAIAPTKLTPDEQHFLDHEVETLCAMVSDWETTAVYRDLPPHVWRYIRERGFLGMIIPKEYGGLGFSAYAHSQVVTKLSTRCASVAVTVLVPNSLGPGELLLHYGTDTQKQHYLPRLAQGVDIPCFALTNPNAGSDAASSPDYGVVCHGEH
jgi:acyl-CoA dehydrogenase